MRLTYCFVRGYISYEQTIMFRSRKKNQKLSSETVADRFNYCRKVYMIAFDYCIVEDGKIGGVGIIIEIDECKIGRRKYESERVVKGS